MSPGHRPAGPLRTPYEALKHAALDNLGSRNTSSLIIDLVSICFEYLQTECTVVTLNSRVTDKRPTVSASRTLLRARLPVPPERVNLSLCHCQCLPNA